VVLLVTLPRLSSSIIRLNPPLAFWPKIATGFAAGFAAGFAQSVGFEWTFLKNGNDSIAKFVDFLFSYSELGGDLHLALKCLPGRKTEGEIRRGEYVGAAASAWKFVDAELGRVGVGLLAGESGAREQGQIRGDSAHRASPSSALQNLRGPCAVEGTVQALTMRISGAELRCIGHMDLLRAEPDQGCGADGRPTPIHLPALFGGWRAVR